MATAAQYQAWIDELEAAKISVAMGKSVTAVGYDGKNVTYTQTNLGNLNALIFELKAKLAQLGAAQAPRRGFPVQFR